VLIRLHNAADRLARAGTPVIGMYCETLREIRHS
jgi:hypothetical protein